MKKIMFAAIALVALSMASCEKTTCTCKIKTGDTTTKQTYNIADYEGVTDCKGVQDFVKRIGTLIDPDYYVKCH